MTDNDDSEARVLEILGQAKSLAHAYRALTGKPFGITGEVAEYEAARLLGVKLTPARYAGYDAIHVDGRRMQIKGRCLLPNSKPGQRLGRSEVSKPFDTVLLDEQYDALEIHEADRERVVSALECQGPARGTSAGRLG